MRSLFIAVLTLLVFATGQVAMAYERCDDPHCSIAGDLNKKQQDDKTEKTSAVHHCCGSHVLNILPTAIKTPHVQTGAVVWPTLDAFASLEPTTLLEPPSSL